MAEENIQTNAPEQDLSEILKVRREKLAALRAEGRDPFKETRFDVTKGTACSWLDQHSVRGL